MWKTGIAANAWTIVPPVATERTGSSARSCAVSRRSRGVQSGPLRVNSASYRPVHRSVPDDEAIGLSVEAIGRPESARRRRYETIAMHGARTRRIAELSQTLAERIGLEATSDRNVSRGQVHRGGADPAPTHAPSPPADAGVPPTGWLSCIWSRASGHGWQFSSAFRGSDHAVTQKAFVSVVDESNGPQDWVADIAKELAAVSNSAASDVSQSDHPCGLAAQAVAEPPRCRRASA
jgi:hypothetical protein